MQKHSLRHTIVTGSLSLPFMVIVTLIAWVLPDLTSRELWIGLALMGVTTYMVIELNNRNQLLRIRSRMMSITYLTLLLACPALHAWHTHWIPMAMLLLSYFQLFASYQKAHAETYTFHAFLFAGIASFFFPPVLIMALGFYFSMLAQLRTFSGRSLTAGLLGLLTPYWLYAGYCIWNNQLDRAFDYLTVWFKPNLPDYALFDLHHLVTLGVIGFYALIAFIHFFHTAYNDKIRTRMLFYTICTQEVILAVGLALYPLHYDMLMGLFCVNSCFLIGHYFALGKGRFFNFWTYLSIAVFAGLTIYNYLF